ncbi:SsgA family sporulation/cell division regulator [Kutzneria sp. NPDC052558]|uniref:SsgA family sporulation/cell division regulator n=1 Tax=Kutzneria sp. NPDC052558 TaxID=3364121 RepID=UPI0037C9D567
MRHDHKVLRAMLRLDYVTPDAPPIPVEVELRYATRDPFAVTAFFHTGSDCWVEWCFARDLLADGLLAEAGLGDVRIRPDLDNAELVVLVVSSPAGTAAFEAYAQDLAEFLDHSYDLVPLGAESEWAGVDDELTGLLAPHDLG